MFGPFQQSSLRIEIAASTQALRESLLHPAKFSQWMFPQRFSSGLPEELSTGLTFMSWVGGVPIQHSIAHLNENSLGLLLSQGIDGFHEWHWGEGWVQSRIEGISILPLGIGQTYALMRLRQFLDAPDSQLHRVGMRF